MSATGPEPEYVSGARVRMIHDPSYGGEVRRAWLSENDVWFYFVAWDAGPATTCTGRIIEPGTLPCPTTS